MRMTVELVSVTRMYWLWAESSNKGFNLSDRMKSVSSLYRGDNTLVNIVVIDSGDLTALQLHYTKQHKELKSPQ